MPTYDYECSACGKLFELFLPMSAAAEQPGPACGGAAHRKIGTGAAVLMRGADAVRALDKRPSCGRQRRCCGSDVRCDKPPCGERQ